MSKSPLSILKNARQYYHKIKYSKRIKQYINSGGMLKLQIGSSDNIAEGWLNTDILIRRPGLAYLDAAKPFPIPSNTLDYIYSEHLIEHLSFTEGQNMLEESFRVLKPGGKIRIACPDFDFLIDLCRGKKTSIQKEYIKWVTVNLINWTNEEEDVIVINNFFQSWGHRFIYNFTRLSKNLTEAGFIDVTICEVGESSDENLRNMEQHGNFLPEKFNRLETMVLEARKPG